MATRGAFVAMVLSAVVLVAAGCETTTAGTAKPVKRGPLTPSTSAGPGPNGPLKQYLLSADDVNEIMGATDIEVVNSSDELSDNSSDISDVSCLGTLYNAEEEVYKGSGWTDVADEILTEPEDDSDHWVEQTIVRFPSEDKALAFYNRTVEDWTNCIGKEVSIDDGEYEYGWRFEGINIVGKSITQTARQTDSDGWACDHTLTAKGVHIVEASACGNSLSTESADLAGKIADGIT